MRYNKEYINSFDKMSSWIENLIKLISVHKDSLSLQLKMILDDEFKNVDEILKFKEKLQYTLSVYYDSPMTINMDQKIFFMYQDLLHNTDYNPHKDCAVCEFPLMEKRNSCCGR